MTPALELDAVSFAYPGGAEMEFDLAVPAGEIVGLLGASGSGKSTLLNLVAGFERPAAGAIRIGGMDVTARDPAARPVTMIFQENNLFHHLSVFDNVALGRSPGLRLSASDRRSVENALADVGLADKTDRLPGELSGGERQRAALARALLRERPVLLLDEPFASLGPALRGEMVELVRDLQRRLGLTVLFVTHAPEDARALAGRVVFLEAGRVAADGAAADFFGDTPPEAFRRYVARTVR